MMWNYILLNIIFLNNFLNNYGMKPVWEYTTPILFCLTVRFAELAKFSMLLSSYLVSESYWT